MTTTSFCWKNDPAWSGNLLTSDEEERVQNHERLNCPENDPGKGMEVLKTGVGLVVQQNLDALKTATVIGG